MDSSKKIYVTKYDYIYYYTKQKALLFHTNSQIINSINAQVKVAKATLIDDEDDEFEISEVDCLEHFREMQEQESTLDQEDAKVVEGIKLDHESKVHICNSFPHIKEVYDFDEKSKQVFDRELAYQKTLSLLKNNKDIIIFQPTFINDLLITKCDALVKEGNQIKIIETKGTSTVKLHHFLDLFYQSQVLFQDALGEYQFDFYLCVVDYIKAAKGTCPFAITPYMNYAKAITAKKKFNAEEKRREKQGYNFIEDENGTYVPCPITITKVLEGDLSELEIKKESTKYVGTKDAIDRIAPVLEKTIDEFSGVIEELYQWKIDFLKGDCEKEFIKDITPDFNDNGNFKKSDYWMYLRTLYQIMGYELFSYSGNMVYQTGPYLQKYQKGDDIKQYFKAGKAELFFDNNQDVVIDRVLTKKYLDQLKDKKVYFDFETINIATRVIDNTFPFMQIITQCSIIISDGTKPYSELTCNNIVIDPKNINVDEFKKVVDALYMGEEYSYVVYNKSFESSRLKEMITYINEPEYTKKIECIINNIYDLADFFQIKKEGVPFLIKEFGGFYSIKKVLPYIEKNHFHLYEETGCKDYKKLAVQNGLMCQNRTTLRFFDKLSPAEWDELYNNIQIYCENDVRAMIAVELFAKKLFAN